MPCVFRTQIGARVSHTATLSKLDYFRLMGKRTDGSHTILEVEHLSIAIICSIHFLQTRIGITSKNIIINNSFPLKKAISTKDIKENTIQKKPFRLYGYFPFLKISMPKKQIRNHLDTFNKREVTPISLYCDCANT